MTGVLWGIEKARHNHRGAVVTIGNFDGVHLGHQKIIKTVKTMAAELGTRSMAITFDPHPIKAIAPDRAPKLLTDTADKALLMRSYGMDNVLVINFTREFASMKPEEFISEVLVKKLNVSAVVVGSGYCFGKAKRGTTDMLRNSGYKDGFKVRVVRHARAIGKIVSSTRIRVVIGNGNVDKATVLLGRPYSIHGKVVMGAGRGGRILSTPTANIETHNEVIPRDGVYVVRVSIGNKMLDAVANIGNNPTFENARRSYEVHILNFESDLRGDELTVHFIKRLRGEVKFPNPGALKEQIGRDIEDARRILISNPMTAL